MDRRHRENVRQVVGGRIEGGDVIVVADAIDPPVAGCGDDEHVRHRLDRVAERLARRRIAPRGVDDQRTIGCGICDRIDRLLIGPARRAVVEDLDRHDPHGGRHADDADAIGIPGNRARDMRAVRLGSLVDGVVVVAEVPAVDVVDIAVGIVVEAVGRGLARVHPQPAGEVGMGAVDTVIQHGHHEVRVAGGELPRLGDVHVDVRSPGEGLDHLTGVVERPLLIEELVARRPALERAPILGLDELDRRVGIETHHRLLQPAGGRLGQLGVR